MKAQYRGFIEHMYIEADVYDLNAVVSSVGGSLGLFLGFSCYEYGKRLIDSIPIGCFRFRWSSTKTSTNNEVVDYLEQNIRKIESGV